MKNIKIFALLAGVAFTTFSCNNDDINPESIFVDSNKTMSEFDKWIEDSLTKQYNITLDYLYVDKETDLEYNTTPAPIGKSIALAKLMKHVWMDPYTEVAGKEFLKKYCFRHFVFLGSGEYTGQGEIKLGQAEGGIKVTLFRVNELDINNIYINNDDYYRPKGKAPLDLNFWYFHTMHHEFCHILTQTKEYTTEFRALSAGDYHGPDWVNVEDEDAAPLGFVTGYATKEYNEDFAEIYSTYVTSSDITWNQILEKAVVDETDANGDIVYVKDNKGNYVYEKDENGNPVLEMDKNEFLIPVRDANGNIVYDSDKNGYKYFTTEEGEKIPMFAEQENIVYTLDEDEATIVAYFVYGGKYYPIEVSDPSFTPIVETTLDGDTAYDKEGNPIQMYYRIPKFEYVKAVEKNEDGKNKILAKLAIVKSYFSTQWGIDIEEIRAKIQEKTSEESLKSLNLKSIKD